MKGMPIISLGEKLTILSIQSAITITQPDFAT